MGVIDLYEHRQSPGHQADYLLCSVVRAGCKLDAQDNLRTIIQAGKRSDVKAMIARETEEPSATAAIPSG